MTVAFDAITSNSTAGTGADASYTHTPVGTPRGVILFATADARNTDTIDTVPTYGGVDFEEVPGSPLILDSTEDGALHVFHLGEGIPTGPQTVAFGVSAGLIRSECVTLTAATDTVVQDTTPINTVGSGDITGTLALGGNTSWCGQAWWSGNAAVGNLTPLASWTSRREFDETPTVTGCYTYDTIGSADVTFGLNQSVSDALLVLGVAIAEVSAGGVTGTGDLQGAAATIAGGGVSGSTGAGALQAQSASLAGAEGAIVGSGVLQADGSSASGSGVSGSIGAGALAIGAAASAGAGVSGTAGTGTLAANDNQITGAGISQSTGSGALSGGTAAIIGFEAVASFPGKVAVGAHFAGVSLAATRIGKIGVA